MPLASLAEVIRRLKAHGYPPVFVLMYDQAWLLCERLWGDLAAVMRRDADEIELDASVFAWALERSCDDAGSGNGSIGNGSRGGGGGGGGGGSVGGSSGGSAAAGGVTATRPIGANFGTPHRDSTYDECHDAATGAATSVAVWVALVRVSERSGCMHVVPRAADPLFARSDHPRHMQPDRALATTTGGGGGGGGGGADGVSPAVPLPAAAGDALMWVPNLIHWGGACLLGADDAATGADADATAADATDSEAEPPPRISIAMEFSAAEDASAAGCGSGSRIRHADLHRGLSLSKRVRLIARSLLTYAHWHAGFAGLAPEVVDECLATMAYQEATTVYR